MILILLYYIDNRSDDRISSRYITLHQYIKILIVNNNLVDKMRDC